MTLQRSLGTPDLKMADALSHATVLVVDDHHFNVVLLERLLGRAGIHNVHVLTDPRQAVARCVELRPDLLLLDLHMPHMDGYAVMAALKAALPADTFLPILVLTADATPAARERALDAGAKDFLTKPFDHVEALQRVRNLLETSVLYRTVQEHNTHLRQELQRRTEEERGRATERQRRRARIEHVLTSDTISVHFQPIIDLRSGDMVGVEALARFESEPHRPPAEWFADAAIVGLGTELELAAVRAALRQLDVLPRATFMSVNLSPATIISADLATVLPTGTAGRLVVELTEHDRVENYRPLLAMLDRLRRWGIRFAVDDAGAGYAGLQHILRLQPDLIKLDFDLTRHIDGDPVRRALASALVSFAKEIDATIVAEGIENQDQLTTLQNLGVAWGQGYYLGRPSELPRPPRVESRRGRRRPTEPD
jgi:EAL domain-containing protein (putative c-di-GMP-specific phosphodiesterase class I)/CheY-like chemotaxis protein